MNLSIIIPLYNEETLIPKLLNKLLRVKLPDFVTSHEIIIVDDCSKDSSFSVVSEFIKDKEFIRLLKHDVNKGKGAAVRTGIENAKGDIFLVQDADLELNPADIPKMLEAMHELNVEFVNGSRYLAGVNRPLSSFKRYAGNRFFTLLTSVLIDVKITDMACGYKLIHRNLYEKIQLEENRFGFEAELILKALKIKRNNIAEVPVQYFPRNEGEGKKLKSSDAFKILFTIFKYGVFKTNSFQSFFKKIRLTENGKFSPSKLFLGLIMLVLLAFVSSQPRWVNKRLVLQSDVLSYYSYLPASFIYSDITCRFTENYKGPHHFIIYSEKLPNGNRVIKTSMGLSLMYMPFFLTGHAMAYITGYDTGGYSVPYKLFLMISALFYLFIGLYYLRKSLLYYFNSTITIITLISIVFGTNLFFYSCVEALMSHSFSFSLFSIFIYLTIKWHQKNTIKNSLLLGFIFGLISLIRPTNSLIILVFIFWGISGYKDFIKRITLFLQNYIHILLIALFTFLVWLPQIIYWKYVTGDFFFYSYGEEGFNWASPHIIDGLFSFRKGWFLYTPLMLLAVLGIPLLIKNKKGLFFPIILFTIINVYVILSWWCWWYGGGFGLRAFIESYSLLAFPLAIFIQRGFFQSKIYKTFSFLLIAFFIFLNIFQTLQYDKGYIHYDSMTQKAYWKNFLYLGDNNQIWKYIESPYYSTENNTKPNLPDGMNYVKNIDPSKKYIISSVNCNSILGVKIIENGQAVIQHTNDPNTHSLFNFEKLSDGSYIIKLNNTKMCLDIPNFAKEEGTKVLIWELNGGDNQRFYISINTDSTYNIISKNSFKYFDIYNGSCDPGTPLIIWEANKQKNQLFKLIPADN